MEQAETYSERCGKGGGLVRALKATFYVDVRGKWRWRITAGNGKILAVSSQGYVYERDCREMFALSVTCKLG